MASLYIKDSATAERVARLAHRLGTTKTALVARALDALEQSEPMRSAPGDGAPSDFAEWLEWHRERSPLPPRTGIEADKAFFDRLWGEDD